MEDTQLTYYGGYYEPLKQLEQEVLGWLNERVDELDGKHQERPVEHIRSRIKTAEGVQEKLERKGYDNDVETAFTQLSDLIGFRLVTHFVGDVYELVKSMKSDTRYRVVKEKDYIALPKPNGYRSYHVIAYYTVQTINGPKNLEVEIQIRTLAMNFWAIIEHSLQYKYKENMPDEVRGRLLRAAKAVDALDMEMSSVRDEIMDAQNSCQIQTNLVKDILNNIQNLYTIANKRELVKIQDEFYRIYETKDLEQLRRFHSDLDNITEGYHVQAFK
mgnify:CR=1 FL=1